MEAPKQIMPVQTMTEELINGTAIQPISQAITQPPQATTKANKVTINNITGYKIPVLSNPSEYFMSDTRINREDTPRNNLKKVHVSDMINAEIFKKTGQVITEKLYLNAIATAFGIKEDLTTKYGNTWLSSYNKVAVADVTQIQPPQQQQPQQNNAISDHKPIVDHFLNSYGSKPLNEQLDLLSKAKTIKINGVVTEITVEIMTSLVNGAKIYDKRKQATTTEL